MTTYLDDNSKAKKMLKVSAIMDVVTAAIYLAVSVTIIVLGATMMNFKPEGEEAAEVLGSAIAGIFVILVGIIFVFFGAVSLVFFIVSVSYGGTTLSLLKKPVDVVAKKVRPIKVGAILGFIFSVALLIAGIVAAFGAPASIALFAALAIMTFVASLINMKMVQSVEAEWAKEAERRREAGEYLI